jgi:hypothetical protein
MLAPLPKDWGAKKMQAEKLKETNGLRIALRFGDCDPQSASPGPQHTIASMGTFAPTLGARQTGVAGSRIGAIVSAPTGLYDATGQGLVAQALRNPFAGQIGKRTFSFSPSLSSSREPLDSPGLSTLPSDILDRGGRWDPFDSPWIGRYELSTRQHSDQGRLDRKLWDRRVAEQLPGCVQVILEHA